MCLSCRHYLITTSIQLETDAAQLLNYTSRIELVGSGNFERSKLVVQLLHPISTINMVLDSECNESTASVAELLSLDRSEGLDYLGCSTGISFRAIGRRQKQPCVQLTVLFLEGECNRLLSCDVRRSTVSQSCRSCLRPRHDFAQASFRHQRSEE